jgi:hypothetical protein
MTYRPQRWRPPKGTRTTWLRHQLWPCENGPVLKCGGGNDELRMNLLVGVSRRGLDGGVAAHDRARRDLGDDGGADEERGHLACGG